MAAARKVAALKAVRRLLVERDGLLVGVLDPRALEGADDDATVAASMNRLHLCLHPAMPAARARELFARARANVLPVVVGSMLVGTVTREDVERAAGRRLRTAAGASAPAAA